MGTDELTKFMLAAVNDAMLAVHDDNLYPESEGWEEELDATVSLINKAIRDWEYDAH